MPTLDEYLGGIFASLTQARMLADVQAVKVAEQYARHDLLRHFAVPHLRFSDVELTIPVAIEAVQSGSKGGIGTDQREAIRGGVARGLAQRLGLRQLPGQVGAEVSSAIDSGIDRLAERSPGRPLNESLDEFAKEVASDIHKRLARAEPALGQRLEVDSVVEVVRKIAGEHVREIAPAGGLGGLQVVAESHRLREQRPSDMIVIKMSISEEGMEWQQMEMSDGRTERKLLPE